jgi:hypothetical protein
MNLRTTMISSPSLSLFSSIQRQFHSTTNSLNKQHSGSSNDNHTQTEATYPSSTSNQDTATSIPSPTTTAPPFSTLPSIPTDPSEITQDHDLINVPVSKSDKTAPKMTPDRWSSLSPQQLDPLIHEALEARLKKENELKRLYEENKKLKEHLHKPIIRSQEALTRRNQMIFSILMVLAYFMINFTSLSLIVVSKDEREKWFRDISNIYNEIKEGKEKLNLYESADLLIIKRSEEEAFMKLQEAIAQNNTSDKEMWERRLEWLHALKDAIISIVQRDVSPPNGMLSLDGCQSLVEELRLKMQNIE